MNLQATLAEREQVQEFLRKHRIGLVTLLFTDIVGSTQLKQTLGDTQAVFTIQRHHALVRETLKSFQEAEEISTAGDSFFIIFAKPSDAVKFALVLQAHLRQSAEQTGLAVSDRIGIHLGEVFIEEREDTAKPKDLYGIQVDTCARVMSLAEGGQILMMRSPFDNARQVLKGQELAGLGELAWLNHGPYVLKGLEEPVEICEVGEVGHAPLRVPVSSDKAHRYVSADQEPVLGWRPAVQQKVPGTQWMLEGKLGEGGFGEVWLGRHATLKEQRVFKFCFRADRVRPLKREVTLFRILKERVGEHPNIVRVHDVFFDEPPYYIEIEYVPGRDLKSWCEAQGGVDKVPLETRFEIAAQVADALQAAHDAGIIHRDIKPSNILITGSGTLCNDVQVKLTDFGIGQVLSEEALAGITRLGFTETLMASGSTALTGTQLYMAPEVLTGRPASVRSDIYSLGVVLYQLLVGDLSRALTTDWAQEISDPFLRQDLARCFAGKPQERFPASSQLAQNLRSLEKRRAAERERQLAVRRAVLKTVLIVLTAVILVPLSIQFVLGWHDRRRANHFMRDLGVVYNETRSYQDRCEIKIEQELTGGQAQPGRIRVTMGGSSLLAFEKPNKLNLVFDLNLGVIVLDTRIICNGEKLWIYVPSLKQYVVEEAPQSASEILDRAVQASPIFGIVNSCVPLYTAILQENPHLSLSKLSTRMARLGTEQVGGKSAYLFSLQGPTESQDTKVWVDKTDALILKVATDVAPTLRLAQPALRSIPGPRLPALEAIYKDARGVLTVTHRDIKIKQAIPETSFAFVPPSEAKKVERFDFSSLVPSAESIEEPLAGVGRLAYPSFPGAEPRQKIPPRDARVKVGMVDLSDHYNVPLTDTWHPTAAGNDLSSLPRGLQTFAGVEFDVRGIIQLSGGTLLRQFAKEVKDVKIGRKCQRLHFLHAAAYGSSGLKGAKIASYVIHYVDGQEKEIPVVYGKDVLDWWKRSQQPPEANGMVVAWRGTNAAVRAWSPGTSIRLFKSTWDNPLPDLEIKSLDYVSALVSVAPFLIAITAEP